MKVVEGRVRLRYNLGRSVVDTDVTLSHVNVSDGKWHVVYAERVGQWSSLRVDFGDGPYINDTTLPAIRGRHLEIHVAKFGLIAGGDVRFPSATAEPLISQDFSDGTNERCIEMYFLASIRVT